MMTHLFLLIVLNQTTGEIDSQDMYFFSVTKCVWYANEINMSIYSSQIGLNAYCIPKLEDPEKVQVYK